MWRQSASGEGQSLVITTPSKSIVSIFERCVCACVLCVCLCMRLESMPHCVSVHLEAREETAERTRLLEVAARACMFVPMCALCVCVCAYECVHEVSLR